MAAIAIPAWLTTSSSTGLVIVTDGVFTGAKAAIECASRLGVGVTQSHVFVTGLAELTRRVEPASRNSSFPSKSQCSVWSTPRVKLESIFSPLLTTSTTHARSVSVVIDREYSPSPPALAKAATASGAA